MKALSKLNNRLRVNYGFGFAEMIALTWMMIPISFIVLVVVL